MWISAQSLAVLGQRGHFFKAALAGDGGRPVLLVPVVCSHQQRGAVLLLLSPRLLSLGEMSVAFAAFQWRFDAEDFDS